MVRCGGGGECTKGRRFEVLVPRENCCVPQPGALSGERVPRLMPKGGLGLGPGVGVWMPEGGMGMGMDGFT